MSEETDNFTNENGFHDRQTQTNKNETKKDQEPIARDPTFMTLDDQNQTEKSPSTGNAHEEKIDSEIQKKESEGNKTENQLRSDELKKEQTENEGDKRKSDGMKNEKRKGSASRFSIGTRSSMEIQNVFNGQTFKRSNKNLTIYEASNDTKYSHKSNKPHWLDSSTMHIKMEEIMWERHMAKQAVRLSQEKDMERFYKEGIEYTARNIEKQKRNENHLLNKRMAGFDKVRKVNNEAFCRMLQRKDREYRLENFALQQRIQEIDKQKQKNIDKLKARVQELEEKKKREQENFIQRMQELEKKRSEEFEATQKRVREIEKRKFNERKAWLLCVQKVDGMKNDTSNKSNATDGETDEEQTVRQKNIKDQARVMESMPDMAYSPRHMKFPACTKPLKKRVRKKKKTLDDSADMSVVGEGGNHRTIIHGPDKDPDHVNLSSSEEEGKPSSNLDMEDTKQSFRLPVAKLKQ